MMRRMGPLHEVGITKWVLTVVDNKPLFNSTTLRLGYAASVLPSSQLEADWIRTHDRSRRAAVDLHLRPRGHWDGQSAAVRKHNLL
jgi:hypothetical protein